MMVRMAVLVGHQTADFSMWRYILMGIGVPYDQVGSRATQVA
jgi:hypothetical protein